MGHFIYDLSPLVITIGHGVMLLLFFVAGSFIRKKFSSKIRKSTSLVIEGTLLSLLLGFTFNNAYDKLLSRKKILNEEINAITSAHAYTCIYPDSVGEIMKHHFAQYATSRRDYYYATEDTEKLAKNMQLSEVTLDSLIYVAGNYYQGHPTEVGTDNMLQQITNLRDIVATREMLRTSRVPAATLRLLLLLSLVVIFLMGVNNSEEKPNWSSACGFTLLITMTIFLIVDLDIAERGTINIDDQQAKIIKAAAYLNEKK